MKIVDGEGEELPRDGRLSAISSCAGLGPQGILQGRGRQPLRDGWFPTGDVATIDADGFMQITDRSKDVIKSGGEWISSIDLENIARGASGDRGSRGDRRAPSEVGRAPLVIAVKKPGASVTWRGPARVLLWARWRSVGARTTSPSSSSCRTRLRGAPQDQAAQDYRDYKLPTV